MWWRSIFNIGSYHTVSLGHNIDSSNSILHRDYLSTKAVLNDLETMNGLIEGKVTIDGTTIVCDVITGEINGFTEYDNTTRTKMCMNRN